MNKHIRTLTLCVVLTLLLAAAACGLSGCANNNTNTEAPQTSPTETAALQNTDTGSVPMEGSTEFVLEVTGIDGITKTQTISTDCNTVADALLEYGMIDGEDGEYGLYIKTVLGETHDYEVDGKYWAFYINGEYAMTGAELTEIVPGTVYAFCAE